MNKKKEEKQMKISLRAKPVLGDYLHEFNH